MCSLESRHRRVSPLHVLTRLLRAPGLRAVGCLGIEACPECGSRLGLLSDCGLDPDREKERERERERDHASESRLSGSAPRSGQLAA